MSPSPSGDLGNSPSLHGCGLWLGEALSLTRAEATAAHGGHLINNGKRGKQRIVPVLLPVTGALDEYLAALPLHPRSAVPGFVWPAAPSPHCPALDGAARAPHRVAEHSQPCLIAYAPALRRRSNMPAAIFRPSSLADQEPAENERRPLLHHRSLGSPLEVHSTIHHDALPSGRSTSISVRARVPANPGVRG